MVQKSAKFRSKLRKAAVTGPKTLSDVSWKQVKLSGPVISDDGADLAGLIGLEILESYDKTLVTKEKRKKLTKDPILSDDDDEQDLPKEQNTKRRKIDLESDSDDDKGKCRKAKKKVNQVKMSEEDFDSKILIRKLVNESDNCENASSPGRFVLLKKIGNERNEQKPAKKKSNKKKISETADNDRKNSKNFSSVEYFKWTELGVTEPIVHALADKCFRNPTEIQTLSIPAAVMGKRDLLGAAETGSGKTLAFGIPLLEGILKLKASGKEEPLLKPNNEKNCRSKDSEEHELTPPPEEMEYYPELDGVTAKLNKPQDMGKPLYALILTPTRELAVQVHNHLKTVAKYTDIKMATVFGGLAAVKQERMLKKCPEIVIATPGRLWELIQSGNSHLSKVCTIRFLVIDETDRMLEKGHFDELKQLLEMINQNQEAKQRRQNFVFSATLTFDHDLPEHMIAKAKKNNKSSNLKETPGQRLNNLVQIIGMTNPKVVDITQQHGTAHSLIESRILCKSDQKDFYLFYFLKRHPGRTLVFCNSIDCVKRLVSLFGYLNCDPLSLFGSMQQRQRLKNLERFTQNSAALLIATDVAARGLDIPNVDHVIHYQVPRTTENYVHRSGRTARASKEGITVLFIGADEVKDYVKLNQSLGRTEDLPMYPTSERMMKQIRQRVNLARDIERMDLHQRRNNESQNWEDKVAKEFMSDSDLDSEQEEERKLLKSKEKRQMKARRLELSRLLATPIVMDRVEMKFPASTTIDLPVEKEQSAITLVRKVVQENIKFKKQRNKKRKFSD
ncbi:ATP-dependent RNA helicase ddx24 [Wyeomyia smithii]|uniref:ATP-dependent RNA helicase ddx24 n=1 Tax=Wyeomyia smithii TaxID=174621 RepID=UPI002467C38F|nr:ATP-dependent RNA helicase ddx24 [Wyeomyia smithii]